MRMSLLGALSLLGPLFALAGAALSEPQHVQLQEPLADDVIDPLADYVCEDPKYEIHLFSHDPLIIYITDFLSLFERDHLLWANNGTFARSNVASATGNTTSSSRTSSSTTARADAVTSCIAERARRFQGLSIPRAHLEPIQLVRYAVGEHYHHHTDWFPAEATVPDGHAGVPRGGNRVSSFFAYVDVSDDIIGGGTNFPKLRAPASRTSFAFEDQVRVPADGQDWSRFVDCDEEWDKGVTFRAVQGNAVFWTNLVAGDNGKKKGDDRVLHAGLPVLVGSKLGMNIWTKEAEFA